MSFHFVDHRRFQRDAGLLIAGAAAAGALVWARDWPLGAAAWWMAAAAGLVTALAGLARRAERGVAGRAGSDGGATGVTARAGVVAAVAAALAGAALAGATWRALAVGQDAFGLADAVIAGTLAGLGATLALAALHIERLAPGLLARSLGVARAALSGDERALAERAVTAQERIAAGLGGGQAAGDAGGEARRLGRLSVDVTLQVLDLAMRCRSLRVELDGIDAGAVRGRAEALADAAARSGDEAARADLMRAARAVLALDERARALGATAERVRARLELQVAMLEATALAVSAGRAAETVDRADAFAPLADRLHQAGGDLHLQAQSLAEATSNL